MRYKFHCLKCGAKLDSLELIDIGKPPIKGVSYISHLCPVCLSGDLDPVPTPREQSTISDSFLSIGG